MREMKKITVRQRSTGLVLMEIPADAAIEFDNGKELITIKVVDGILHVAGDGPLSVFPRAANLVAVTTQ